MSVQFLYFETASFSFLYVAFFVIIAFHFDNNKKMNFNLHNR